MQRKTKHKIKIDARIKILCITFIVLLISLVIFTVLYEYLPLPTSFSLWGQDSFYSGLITNMYNGVIDFLLFSIVLYVFLRKQDKNDLIQKYQNNIDDCRFWVSDESAYRNAANIRRLVELNVSEFDLSKSNLSETKLKKMLFENSKFMGARLTLCNLENTIFMHSDLQACDFSNSKLLKIEMNGCNLKYAIMNGANLGSSRISNTCCIKLSLIDADCNNSLFLNCDFTDAILDNCNFERANLSNSKNLTSSQLLKCKSIKYITLNKDLEKEINVIDPTRIGKNRPS